MLRELKVKRERKRLCLFSQQEETHFQGSDSQNPENMFQTLDVVNSCIMSELCGYGMGVGGCGGTRHMMATCITYISCSKDMGEEPLLLKALFGLTAPSMFYAGIFRPCKSKPPLRDKSGRLNSDMYLLSRSKCFLKSKQKLNIQS